MGGELYIYLILIFLIGGMCGYIVTSEYYEKNHISIKNDRKRTNSK